MQMHRRQFVLNLAVFAASDVIPSRLLFSQEKKASARGASPLPVRRELIVKNGYVMTMDSGLGDIQGADVHIRNGEIVAVGKGISAAGATMIDARRMIVL